MKMQGRREETVKFLAMQGRGNRKHCYIRGKGKHYREWGRKKLGRKEGTVESFLPLHDSIISKATGHFCK
jgi:hypothetical protein